MRVVEKRNRVCRVVLVMPLSVNRSSLLCLSALGLCLSAPAHALTVQNSTNWLTGSAGTLGTNNVTVAGLVGSSTSFDDLSGSDYNPPLSSTQPTSYYNERSDWAASFGNPISDLGLYLYGWRGGVNYTFSQAPTLLSGCSNGTISGNTLSLSGGVSDYCDGILRFTGSISTLSVDSSLAAGGNTIGLTFATFSDPTPPTSVPGPLPLFGAGAAFAWSRRLRRSIQANSRRG